MYNKWIMLEVKKLRLTTSQPTKFSAFTDACSQIHSETQKARKEKENTKLVLFIVTVQSLIGRHKRKKENRSPANSFFSLESQRENPQPIIYKISQESNSVEKKIKREPSSKLTQKRKK
jgi:hypothetical protein